MKFAIPAFSGAEDDKFLGVVGKFVGLASKYAWHVNSDLNNSCGELVEIMEKLLGIPEEDQGVPDWCRALSQWFRNQSAGCWVTACRCGFALRLRFLGGVHLPAVRSGGKQAHPLEKFARKAVLYQTGVAWILFRQMW